MIGIYKITSPSNKVYIGQSKDIEKRFKQYMSNSCKTQIRLVHSFNKYGVENHIFEILEECDIEELNIRERHYQDLYEVIGKNGLNCMLINTNDLPKILSEETRLKLSESRIGYKFSQESKNKMSKSAKGKKHSPERLAKHKQANMNKSIPIICTITKEIWYSVRKCAKDNNVTKSSLNYYLNGKSENKTSLVYLKNYVENNQTIMENEINNENELDCPYEFTSRCTMGRCDCKPKLNEK